jgi:hypothetical protein
LNDLPGITVILRYWEGKTKVLTKSELFARDELSKKEGNDESNPPFESKHINQPYSYFAANKAATCSAVIALLKIRISSYRLKSDK